MIDTDLLKSFRGYRLSLISFIRPLYVILPQSIQRAPLAVMIEFRFSIAVNPSQYHSPHSTFWLDLLFLYQRFEQSPNITGPLLTSSCGFGPCWFRKCGFAAVKSDRSRSRRRHRQCLLSGRKQSSRCHCKRSCRLDRRRSLSLSRNKSNEGIVDWYSFDLSWIF